MEDEALFEMIEQQPGTNICTLPAELGPPQSPINRRLHKLNLVNRRCRKVDRELTNDQAQRRMNILRTTAGKSSRCPRSILSV